MAKFCRRIPGSSGGSCKNRSQFFQRRSFIALTSSGHRLFALSELVLSELIITPTRGRLKAFLLWIFCCLLTLSSGSAHDPRLPPVIPLDDIAILTINASTCSPQPLPDTDTPFRPTADQWRTLYTSNPYRPQSVCGHWSDCRLRCTPCVGGTCRCAEVQFVGCYTYLPFTRVLVEINVERCADRIVRNFTTTTGVGVVRERQCACEQFDPGPRPDVTPILPFNLTATNFTTTTSTSTTAANLVEQVGIFRQTTTYSTPETTALLSTTSAPPFTDSISTTIPDLLIYDSATTTYDALKPCYDSTTPGNTLCSSMSAIKCSWPLFISVCCGTCGRLYDEELMRHTRMEGTCVDTPPEPGYCETRMSRSACYWPMSMRRCCATCSTTYGVDENEVGSSLEIDDDDDSGIDSQIGDESWTSEDENQPIDNRPAMFPPFSRPDLPTFPADILTPPGESMANRTAAWAAAPSSQAEETEQNGAAHLFRLDGSDRLPEVLQVHMPTIIEGDNGSFEVAYNAPPADLRLVVVPDQIDSEAYWAESVADTTTRHYFVTDDPYDENAVRIIPDDGDDYDSGQVLVDHSEEEEIIVASSTTNFPTTTQQMTTEPPTSTTTTTTEIPTTTTEIITTSASPRVEYGSMICFDAPGSRELCSQSMNITLCAWPLYSQLCCETCDRLLVGKQQQSAATAPPGIQAAEQSSACVDDADHTNFCPRMNQRTCRWPVSRQLCCGTCSQFVEQERRRRRRRRRSEHCADKWSTNKCIGHATIAMCTEHLAFASNCCATCKQLLVLPEASANKKIKRIKSKSSCVEDASRKQYCSKLKLSSCRYPIAHRLCCSKCRVLQ